MLLAVSCLSKQNFYDTIRIRWFCATIGGSSGLRVLRNKDGERQSDFLNKFLGCFTHLMVLETSDSELFQVRTGN